MRLSVLSFSLPLLFFAGSAAASSVDDERVARGRYLVAFGGCHDCHTPVELGPDGPRPIPGRELSGHPEWAALDGPPAVPAPFLAVTSFTVWAGPWGVSYSANLTPDVATGIGGWDEEKFLRVVKSGMHSSGTRPMLPPMPWQALVSLSDADLRAIFAYLQSLPPVRNRVPEPQPPADEPSLAAARP